MSATTRCESLWWPGIAVWAALNALLLLTWGLAYVPMGALNTWASMGIAVVKALLVAVFFMHLNKGGALLRLASIVGLAWLAILFALTFADYRTRDWNPDQEGLRPGFADAPKSGAIVGEE